VRIVMFSDFKHEGEMRVSYGLTNSPLKSIKSRGIPSITSLIITTTVFYRTTISFQHSFQPISSRRSFDLSNPTHTTPSK
jgi:hypothetical protein